ncbi:MAG: VTT domain-containing protein [Rhodospirillaceae bacterium]|nr:VTT domain-containing protein [Rhodospirillaceae bacterium]
MIEAIQFLMDAAAGNPWLLAGALILATFILEDAAMIAGALMAADGIISPWLAIGALIGGITLGDLGLYGLGKYAIIHVRIRRWLEGKRLQEAGEWLRKRVFWTVIGARFVPGMRLPVYTACGLFQASFLRFLTAVGLAAFVWTGALFALLYFAGKAALAALGSWTWLIGVVILLVLIIGPRILASRRSANAATG